MVICSAFISNTKNVFIYFTREYRILNFFKLVVILKVKLQLTKVMRERILMWKTISDI